MDKALSPSPQSPPMVADESATAAVDSNDFEPTKRSHGIIPHIREYFRLYLWKVDLHIIPLFLVIYFFSVMDRNNVGNAKVAGLDEALNLHGNQFNWIASSMFFTYIFFEIPANIMLKKVKPSWWFPFIIIAWGGICMCMAAAKNYGSMIVLRLFLGAVEAGFVPGFIYYISFWYTKRQQGPRLSIFFSAGTFAGIFSGPIAAGLTNINGSLKEYQYIFLVEGGITVGLGIITILILSNYPEDAKYLNETERQTILNRLKDEKSLSGDKDVIVSRIPRILLDWKLWAYAIIFWVSATAGSTQAIFGPTLIASMGYTSTKAQILSSLPSACGFVSQILSMFIPRLFPHTSILIMIHALFTCACYAVLSATTGDHIRLAFLCLANFGTSPIMPYVSLWMLNNTVGVTQRAVGSALTVMLGGIGGLIGSHLYRSVDKPYYRRGHIAISILHGILFLVALGLALYFIYENKRRDKLESTSSDQQVQEVEEQTAVGSDDDVSDSKVEVLGDKVLSHRYVY